MVVKLKRGTRCVIGRPRKYDDPVEARRIQRAQCLKNNAARSRRDNPMHKIGDELNEITKASSTKPTEDMRSQVIALYKRLMSGEQPRVKAAL